MKIEDCEGCTIIEYSECSWFSETLICPCSICLVKVVCTDACDLLIDHSKRLNSLLKKYEKDRLNRFFQLM